jgi:protein-S-isoprenylcysteine O-methyltransferase Ste14
MRAWTLAVAGICYTAFFAAFVYFIGFVAAIDLLPTHVDKGLSAGIGTALLVDVALIALFGVQHSVMARPGFKARWIRVVPRQLERSVYCLAAAAALMAMMLLWHPIPGWVWHVTEPTARTVLWALLGLGFVVVFTSTHLISHWELFGLSQAWHHVRGSEATARPFQTPLFYRAVRHPLYTGFLIALWATPDMSYGHLLLALGLTAYVLVAIGYEERDLLATFGDQYADYRKRVGALIPGIGRRA